MYIYIYHKYVFSHSFLLKKWFYLIFNRKGFKTFGDCNYMYNWKQGIFFKYEICMLLPTKKSFFKKYRDSCYVAILPTTAVLSDAINF
jgi:hypothetical protein